MLYLKYISISVFCAYIITIVFTILFFPSVNWDMIAYVALVIDNTNVSISELHRVTWDSIRATLSDGEFIELTQTNAYRVKQFEDPAAFNSVLGFYQIKFLYIELAKVLSSAFTPIVSLRIISVLSVLGIGVLTLYWFRNEAETLSLVVPLLLISDFGRVAVHVTPDIFAGFLLLFGSYLAIKDRKYLSAVFYVMAVAARPDHIVFIVVMYLYLLVNRTVWWPTILCMTASILTYFLVTSIGEHPGWWVHMWFTHINYEPSLVGFDAPYKLLTHIEIFLRAIARSFIGETWVALLIIQLLLLIALHKKGWSFDKNQKLILTAIFTSMILKFAVFPTFETRFHAPYLLISGYIILAKVLLVFRA